METLRILKMGIQVFKGNLIKEGIIKNVKEFHNDEYSLMQKDDDIAVYHNGVTWRGTKREIEEHFGTEQMLQFLKWLHPDSTNRYTKCLICGCLVYDKSAAYCEKHREEGNRRTNQILEETPPEEFANLALEIIRSVAMEYRIALKKLKKNPNNSAALSTVWQDEAWFRSSLFEVLSLRLLDGEKVIEEIRIQEGVNYDEHNPK